MLESGRTASKKERGRRSGGTRSAMSASTREDSKMVKEGTFLLMIAFTRGNGSPMRFKEMYAK